MPQRVLITGMSGFAGSHLAERGRERGYHVDGFDRDVADVTDVAAVRAIVERARPDVVVHLAGQAVPSLAAADVRAAIHVNVEGTAAVVEALRDSAARLVFASSAEVYGHPDVLPAREDTPLRPPNVYAATKVAAETIARTLGTRATILRPVNQVGPRQHPLLVASQFARQVALAEMGAGEPVIRHGRLDAKRDFLDVRDMADAYLAAADLEDGGTYNVGTGSAVEIAELLRMLVGLARVPVRTELDPALVRPGDPFAFTVDTAAFRARTGWTPRIPLARSVADLLDYWRQAVRSEVAVTAS